ncbi:Ferroxidase [Methanobacterium lacus]|uniref:Ferroxidase n=1 Tax=Methanobacterium lacus (strain AL-21) TaxID=877455 RepID=F0TCH1_METLA|nr:ferritin [Methanobacterium lacus]ADZ09248.1 Ferroxidase [Methanobacterium lacus]
MDEKMVESLNSQLNAEMYSAYLYLSMGAYFEDLDLGGFANWMRVQAQEEMTHAMKIHDFIIQRGDRVTLTKIEAPPTEWESPVNAFEHVYKHEQKVTGLINQLVNLALSLGDHATNNFLQWFVAEQVEEEESSSGVLKKVKMANDSLSGMLMLDNELSQRIFTPPATTK